MKRRDRSTFIALSLLVLPVAAVVSLSSAQGARISKGALAIPQGILSLPKSLGSAMLRSSVMLAAKPPAPNGSVITGGSYHNDTSPQLRDMEPLPIESFGEREANENPKVPIEHKDSPDEAVQKQHVPAPSIPGTVLNFDGIPFPGVACNCAPPDTDGEVGLTQYVQIVNEGFQVFDKTTGLSVLGPSGIETIWTGFGGACETAGHGDPIVLYDQLANRWLISQFATPGGGPATDECVAVSTTSDATGSYNRYGFHLGTNFFDYPKISVWPDAYYMSMNVFNAAGTAYLGPQPFALDRAKMLAGLPATFVSAGITGGPSEAPYLPADLDGSTLPAAGAPGTFVEFPAAGAYKVYHFHADFAVPGNTTFTLFASPAAAGFTELCPTTRACVPQLGSGTNLDGIGDRLMHRLAYRNFGAFESVVGNFTVSAGGVAGIRWFELRNVTSGPVTVFQESTYQPDGNWRWMGSAAMDQQGNLALGFSTSSASIFPQIRYAGRLVSDPIGTLAQGEAHLFDGTGSQLVTGSRWGDYSALTIDPVDDCTFWYTQEYYATTSQFNWRTRIGNFKFSQCTSTPQPVIVPAGATITSEGCAPPNNAIDPGETVTVSLCLQNVGTLGTSNLVGTLQNSGGVTGASGPQTYGAMAPGAAVCRAFTFTATGSCGDTLTATVHLQDGAADLGNAVFTLKLGTLTSSSLLSESFDGVAAPALPAGWTTAASGAESAWVTAITNPFSAPNDAFAPDPATIGNTELVSPSLAVPSGGAQLTFQNAYNMENTFDGMVLEISINGGAFQDILAAGGNFTAGGYNGTISTLYSSPIAGRQAWTGLSGGTTAAPAYVTTTANLPAAASGQNFQLKWRAATDNSVSASGDAGVRVDDVSVTGLAYVCCLGQPPTPTPTPALTQTPTSTPTSTPTGTATSTPTDTPTSTPTATPTPTSSNTPTSTRTSTHTNTPTGTPTITRPPTSTRTPTPTRTATSTRTSTRTATATRTPTITRPPTSTRTATPTRTATSTRTSTRTNTPIGTPTFTPTPRAVVVPPLTDFRGVRRASDITAGPDVGGTGHTAMNFAGSSAASGDTWITVYDTTPGTPDEGPTYGSVNLAGDILIGNYNNKKGPGLLALFHEGTGQKGLALIVYDSGNSDSLALGTVDKATGQFTALKSVSLGGNVKENTWYRLTMAVVVSGSNVTVTGKVFGHTTATDPNSPIGAQLGVTLSFSGARPAGVDAAGEVGMAASAFSAAVTSSLTNFTIGP